MTLKFWLDPSDPDTVTLDGSRVTAVTDKSNTGNDLDGGVIADLIASFNGEDAATVFTSEDTNQRVATFIGAAALDTAQSKFGGASLVCAGGSPVDRVTFPDSADWEFGSGQFTVEFWVRFNGDPGAANVALVGQYDSAADERGWLIDLVSNTLRFAWTTDGTGGTFASETTAWNPATATWYHIAITRDATNLRMFVDGALLKTVANSATFHAAASVLAIGASSSGLAGLTGNIDDVRIVKGTALYTAAFNVPKKPHTIPPTLFSDGPYNSPETQVLDFEGLGSLQRANSSPALIDMGGPDFTAIVAHSRVLLGSPIVYDLNGDMISVQEDSSPLDDSGWSIRALDGVLRGGVGDDSTDYVNILTDPDTHFLAAMEGADGATSYTSDDNGKRVATFVGTAQIDTAQSKFGGSSMLFDGNSDGIHFPASPDWSLGTKEFTVEFWVRFAVDPSSNMAFIGAWGSSGQQQWVINLSAANLLQFNYSTTGSNSALKNKSWNPAADTWYHIAIERFAGDLYIFVDGTQLGTEDALTDDIFWHANTVLDLGSLISGSSQWLNGWLDDVRLTVGRAVYQGANFTPPDEPLISAYGDKTDGITAITLDQTRNSLVGYNNGHDVGGHSYAGTLGFAHTLEIGTALDGSLIHEVIYTDNSLLTDERQRAEGYLAHKWNVPDILSAAHPFKAQAPDIVNVPTLLLKFDGADGDTTYTSDDDSARTVTFNGTAALEDSRKKYGRTSLFLDGNSDWVSVPHNNDLSILTTEDQTIECWVYMTSNPAAGGTIINKGGISGSAWPNYILEVRGDNSPDNRIEFGVYQNGGSIIQLIGPPLELNTWTHLAATWDFASDTATLFVDGIEVDSGSSATTPFNPANPLTIGRQGSGGTAYFPGYVDNVRIMQGVNLYPNNFTPPHRSFQNKIEADFIANFNGPAGVSPEEYTSEGVNPLVGVLKGDAELDTSNKKFGTRSLRMQAASGFIEFPDDAAWHFGANDFTVEAWVCFESIQDALIAQYTDADRGWYFGYVQSVGELRFVYHYAAGGTSQVASAAWTVELMRWQHIAVTRHGDEIKLWIDGAQVGTTHVMTGGSPELTLHNSAEPLLIGSLDELGGFYHDGWWDGVRVTKGKALYGIVETPDQIDTHEFTPDLLIKFDATDGDTAYTTDDANALALTFDNAELDDVERVFGATSLWMSSATESAVVPSDAATTLGDTDFTIEVWIRPDTIGGTQIFYDQRVSGGTEIRPTIYLSSGQLLYYVNGVARISGSTLSADTWYHVVVERYNGVTRMYLDGVQDGSDYTDGNDYASGALTLGEAGYVDGSGMQGWIDGVRIFNSRAIYAGDFTLPIDAPGDPLL